MTDPLKTIHLKNLKYLSNHLKGLVEGRLWLKIIIGMFLGILLGFVLGPDLKLISRSVAEIVGNWLALPGRFFLALIQMIVIPLIVASVVRGLASGESLEQLRKLGLRVVFYFIFTTIIAILIGLTVASIVRPGDYVADSFVKETEEEIIVNKEELKEKKIDFNNIPGAIMTVIPQNPLGEMVNAEMLQVVIFSIIVGLALISLTPKQAKPLLNLLGSVQLVSMKVVKWAMQLAPVAVFGLMAQLTIKTGAESLAGIGVYFLTVLLALFLMLGLYLIIVFVFGGIKPWNFIVKIKDVQLLAFSTDSSVATMPLTIKTAEEKLQVRPSISQFIIPVGATVNMDATALFQGVATIFIAQVYSLELGLGTLLILIVTSVASSVGTPATPGVGIIVLVAVLKSVGVPVEGVALIIGVDRILEMFRTSINVTGDLTASVVMNKLVKSKQSYEEEVQYQEELKREQKKTGEDVITGEFKAKNSSVISGFVNKIKRNFNNH